MNINHLPKGKGRLSPLYFYRYAMKDLMQEFLYIQMKENKNAIQIQSKFKKPSMPSKFPKAQELFDSDLFKCYKFYL